MDGRQVSMSVALLAGAVALTSDAVNALGVVKLKERHRRKKQQKIVDNATIVAAEAGYGIVPDPAPIPEPIVNAVCTVAVTAVVAHKKVVAYARR